MDPDATLTDQFEGERARLRSVAQRLLGSSAEADDAVQEAWVRLSRTDATEVGNLGGWLTTVVSRVCLDMLRARRRRPIDPRGDDALEPVPSTEATVDPETEALLGDSVGLALVVVLERLAPAERVAFVLHDLFAVPFDEIAPVVGRTAEATRQLASRARRRVRGAEPGSAADRERQREVVEAFLAASRGGDLTALLAVLDPDVVVRADDAAVATGADAEVVGAVAVAATFAGRAKTAQPAVVGGNIGLVWAYQGTPKVAFDLVIVDDRIMAIDLIADADHLADLDLELL
ncbi:MAG TPA: sigma-70 family RNA polymerase sigma factor [Iamia sp.]|jgi:RNA polymerase sigma-70 factor (ECF subfamily)|nr:sigma-70 family RNA polymerase sigma factor [Iamia sp.]